MGGHIGYLRGPNTLEPSETLIPYHAVRALDGNPSGSVVNGNNIWKTRIPPVEDRPLMLGTIAQQSSNCVHAKVGDWMLYNSNRNLNGNINDTVNVVLNIWLIKSDGTQDKCLTNLTAAGTSTAVGEWHPRLERLIYGSARNLDGTTNGAANLSSNIWAMNADGTDQRALTRLVTTPGLAAGVSYGNARTPKEFTY